MTGGMWATLVCLVLAAWCFVLLGDPEAGKAWLGFGGLAVMYERIRRRIDL